MIRQPKPWRRLAGRASCAAVLLREFLLNSQKFPVVKSSFEYPGVGKTLPYLIIFPRLLSPGQGIFEFSVDFIDYCHIVSCPAGHLCFWICSLSLPQEACLIPFPRLGLAFGYLKIIRTFNKIFTRDSQSVWKQTIGICVSCIPALRLSFLKELPPQQGD